MLGLRGTVQQETPRNSTTRNSAEQYNKELRRTVRFKTPRNSTIQNSAEQYKKFRGTIRSETPWNNKNKEKLKYKETYSKHGFLLSLFCFK